MKRTKLKNRSLPAYTKAEEIMNMVTHIVGGALGIFCLAGGLGKSIPSGSVIKILSAAIYGFSMLCLYAISSVYHGLLPGMGKRVLQVLDHCAIYFLIAGTYTPIALVALASQSPALGWGMAGLQWAMAALAVTLTAIDLKKYNIFSMTCYIGMGWAILPFLPHARTALGQTGFSLLLWGGIVYTLGAILYGIGAKKPWFHSVFHIFVVLGSALQMLCVLFYVL